MCRCRAVGREVLRCLSELPRRNVCGLPLRRGCRGRPVLVCANRWHGGRVRCVTRRRCLPERYSDYVHPFELCGPNLTLCVFVQFVTKVFGVLDIGLLVRGRREEARDAILAEPLLSFLVGPFRGTVFASTLRSRKARLYSMKSKGQSMVFFAYVSGFGKNVVRTVCLTTARRTVCGLVAGRVIMNEIWSNPASLPEESMVNRDNFNMSNCPNFSLSMAAVAGKGIVSCFGCCNQSRSSILLLSLASETSTPLLSILLLHSKLSDTIYSFEISSRCR